MKLVKSRCVEIAERIMREIWLSVRGKRRKLVCYGIGDRHPFVNPWDERICTFPA